jgi:signal transduction histidine kinase
MWRHPAFGYIAIFPLIAVTMYIWQMQTGLVLPGAFLSLALVLVASFWGAWPAIVMLILVIGCLDYFMTPRRYWLPADWQGALQLLLSGVVGLLLIWFIARRERAHIKALIAKEETQAHAEALGEMNQMKDRFVSIASHELKTPVTTIRVQTQFILRRLSKQKELGPDKEFLVRSLQRINEQTERLTTLIVDLLEKNKTPTDKITLNRRSHDLNEICQKVIEDQRLLTERQIVLNLSDSPIEAYVDSDRLAQVIINLVGNALKYSPETSSPVEVSTSQDAKHVLIQVRDYGHGIAKDDLPRIFEIFYRTPDAQTSCASGLGLGLAIAKEIVELHEGRIWCESEVGQGSTFFVELPLGNEE